MTGRRGPVVVERLPARILALELALDPTQPCIDLLKPIQSLPDPMEHEASKPSEDRAEGRHDELFEVYASGDNEFYRKIRADYQVPVRKQARSSFGSGLLKW